jgi:hypothetical protein
MVSALLDDLDRAFQGDFEVILTLNIVEKSHLSLHRRFPLRVIENSRPMGFGENHNQAFGISRGCYFIVMNPDIRLGKTDFAKLIEPFKNDSVGAVAPVIVSPEGQVEDSVRFFPTLPRILRRVIWRACVPDYYWDKDPIEVEWCGGMFIIFRRDAFFNVLGFDHRRFFMYMEDVDICRRMWEKGWKVILHPRVEAIHAAQRASRKSFRHMKWHVSSMVRYLLNI